MGLEFERGLHEAKGEDKPDPKQGKDKDPFHCACQQSVSD